MAGHILNTIKRTVQKVVPGIIPIRALLSPSSEISSVRNSFDLKASDMAIARQR